MFYRFTIK